MLLPVQRNLHLKPTILTKAVWPEQPVKGYLWGWSSRLLWEFVPRVNSDALYMFIHHTQNILHARQVSISDLYTTSKLLFVNLKVTSGGALKVIIEHNCIKNRLFIEPAVLIGRVLSPLWWHFDWLIGEVLWYTQCGKLSPIMHVYDHLRRTLQSQYDNLSFTSEKVTFYSLATQWI